MKIRLDERMADAMRSVNEVNLRDRGASSAGQVAVATVEGTARFLQEHLGTAAAYGVIAGAADRIVERGARDQAVAPDQDAGRAPGGMRFNRFSRFLPKGLGRAIGGRS